MSATVAPDLTLPAPQSNVCVSHECEKSRSPGGHVGNVTGCVAASYYLLKFLVWDNPIKIAHPTAGATPHPNHTEIADVGSLLLCATCATWEIWTVSRSHSQDIRQSSHVKTTPQTAA